MTDLEVWAKTRGMDLDQHLAAETRAAVRERSADLEKQHQAFLRKIDKALLLAAAEALL